ncbi:MAG: DNA-directed RNA polymerase subunit A' [archaeon]|nr:DNA-directed RNA polymerase subunit A' [archaeon]
MKGIIKKINQINFGLMSPDDIREMSVVKIETPDTYDEDGYPIENGLMDPHLGVIDPSLKCRTCGFRGGECQGHFGRIDLARPVIHVGFGDDIHKILRSTCNECGRLLLSEERIEEFRERIIDANEKGQSIGEIIKEVYNEAKNDTCPHCGTEQEDVKIDKPISILIGDYKLTASEVREKLERITDDDAFVLGVDPAVARPEWMVLTVLPVPPVTVRPSITLDTGERSEDDLTHKLVDILRINQRLTENMEAGAPQLIVEDLWELLQYHVTTYFDNEASGVPPARHRSGRPLKTLAQRLKGKEGRFRSNLSGKRVNFSARTVISPDPNISINEVGVPEMIAKEVTVPTYVNEWNIDSLREMVERGPNQHPGANYVKKDRGNKYSKVRVLDSNKEVVSENLKYGDIVMRHLNDGDVVLFNRQPSLHRMSMMAHEVRVLPYKTFRLNLCVCPPYNADFDGDEMNMHVFQTDESRAEAKSLMRVQEHILSPRFGGPIIGAIHDHISGAYLLTRQGSEFTEDAAFQVIRKSHLLNLPWKQNDEGKYVKIDESGVETTSKNNMYLARKGRNWTGKELFSLLLPYDLNMNYKAEVCYKCEECKKEQCEFDGYVVIRNGELIYGGIDEKAYGSFSGKILDKIVKEYGPAAAKDFLDRSTDLAICGIMKTGITTSTNDEEIPEEAMERIEEHLVNAEEKVDQLIDAYEEGTLEALPGRGLEETLEMKIMQVLGEARDKSGVIAEEYFTMHNNHSVVMARTGARASMLNLAQITACVGQQAVRGGRIERGYLSRPLPHFRKHELGARAKGFVHSSYKSGLDPIEFFFHAMGGREGLVDTAIRTAQSGYMQRRLVNALEDLQVKPSGLVTNNNGQVIQRLFGEDGLDPAKSDFGKVADLDKLIDEIKMESK